MDNSKLVLERTELEQDDEMATLTITMRSKELKRPDTPEPGEKWWYIDSCDEERYTYLKKIIPKDECITQRWRASATILKYDVNDPAGRVRIDSPKTVTKRWRNQSDGRRYSIDGPKIRFRYSKRMRMLDIVGPEGYGETPLGKIYDVPIEDIIASWDDPRELRAVRLTPSPLSDQPEDDDLDDGMIGEIVNTDLWIEKQKDEGIWFNAILKDDGSNIFMVKFYISKGDTEPCFHKLREDNREAYIVSKGAPDKVLPGISTQGMNSPDRIMLPHHATWMKEYEFGGTHMHVTRQGYDIYIEFTGDMEGSARYRPSFGTLIRGFIKIGKKYIEPSYESLIEIVTNFRKEGNLITSDDKTFRRSVGRSFINKDPEPAPYALDDEGTRVYEEPGAYHKDDEGKTIPTIPTFMWNRNTKSSYSPGPWKMVLVKENTDEILLSDWRENYKRIIDEINRKAAMKAKKKEVRIKNIVPTATGFKSFQEACRYGKWDSYHNKEYWGS